MNVKWSVNRLTLKMHIYSLEHVLSLHDKETTVMWKTMCSVWKKLHDSVINWCLIAWYYKQVYHCFTFISTTQKGGIFSLRVAILEETQKHSAHPYLFLPWLELNQSPSWCYLQKENINNYFKVLRDDSRLILKVIHCWSWLYWYWYLYCNICGLVYLS